MDKMDNMYLPPIGHSDGPASQNYFSNFQGGPVRSRRTTNPDIVQRIQNNFARRPSNFNVTSNAIAHSNANITQAASSFSNDLAENLKPLPHQKRKKVKSNLQMPMTMGPPRQNKKPFKAGGLNIVKRSTSSLPNLLPRASNDEFRFAGDSTEMYPWLKTGSVGKHRNVNYQTDVEEVLDQRKRIAQSIERLKVASSVHIF